MTAASLADGRAQVFEPPLEPDVPESDRVEVEPPIPPGALLAGRYSVENVLAEGGMGVVWLGRHVELDKPVAIKFLRRALCGKEAVVARFLNEARAAAALRSNHVVRVMDVGQLETGRPYLVMEHLQGIDLDALVEQEGPISVARAVDYVLQVCEALSEAHAAGIVHRDIKPENLFLSHFASAKPIVKVVDFGLAKRLDGAAAKVVTGPFENMGSPCYMSPEQIESPQELDERTDIWSLGVVLYRLLTAVLPFDGDSVAEVCARVLNATPVLVSKHRPELDTGIEAIVARCLEKKPEDRYQSIGDLEQALRSYEAAAVTATQPGSMTRSSLRELAPPKRASHPEVPKIEEDEPIGEIPGVHRLRARSVVFALLFGFAVPLLGYGGFQAARHTGFRPRMLTNGWVTPAELSADAPVDPRVPFVPSFAAVPAERASSATAEVEVKMGHQRKKRDRFRATPPVRAVKITEEPELTPEEIVRRKLAYEEYLQQHGYQQIGDVLKQMRTDGTNPDPGGARGKASDRVPKTDVPRP
jgi:serine/threonine protein kinase